MDEIARGVATAALTLQATLLQSLVANGAMTLAQALNVIARQGVVKGGAGCSAGHGPSAGGGPGGVGGCSELRDCEGASRGRERRGRLYGDVHVTFLRAAPYY